MRLRSPVVAAACVSAGSTGRPVGRGVVDVGRCRARRCRGPRLRAGAARPRSNELARSGHTALGEHARASAADKPHLHDSGASGPVPPENQPGHRPEVDQDKPRSAPTARPARPAPSPAPARRTTPDSRHRTSAWPRTRREIVALKVPSAATAIRTLTIPILLAQKALSLLSPRRQITYPSTDRG